MTDPLPTAPLIIAPLIIVIEIPFSISPIVAGVGTAP